MILLDSSIVPKPEIIQELGAYQADIDQLPTFRERSEAAKHRFAQKNKKGNHVFDEVKKSLSLLCAGARRCAYCEDSVADEVEHIYPKDLYPGKTFQWENLLYVCGNCNGPKNNKFAVFRVDTGIFQQVNPVSNQTPSQEPPNGRAVLINPRIDDPLTFCMLDLADTFNFVIIATEDSDDHTRADYTYNEVLRLNHREREFLRQAREEAYHDYKARLVEYIKLRNEGASDERLEKMIEQLKKKNHPTVWKEMQRYKNRGILQSVDPELSRLFDEAPQALLW
jgi:uncharacterized protein (TIGR02646 family)